MKKMLIIANEFPPIGGSGVQRSVNFVSELPSFGYEPHVITRDYKYGLYDESLMSKIPEEAVIYKLTSFDFLNRPGFIGKVLRFISTRFMVPDGEYFWYKNHRDRVLEILDQEGINKVYSTSYPYSDHLMALYLKKQRPDIEWVTDFRDEWTNNPYFADQFHMKLRESREVKMEREIVETCDYLITNTPFMLENFLRDTPDKKINSTFIPNGYSDLDFIDYRLSNQDNRQFRLTYMGALYGKRKPDYFLEALKLLLDEGTIDRDQIELEFIGNYHRHIMDELSERYGLNGVMKITDYMEHSALLKYMSGSNLLVLIESEKNFYTGKVFEYIKLGIPILATVPVEGAAASVVRDTNTGTVVPFASVEQIKTSITNYYKDWQLGELNYHPDEEAIEAFSWKSHAKSILACFKEE